MKEVVSAGEGWVRAFVTVDESKYPRVIFHSSRPNADPQRPAAQRTPQTSNQQEQAHTRLVPRCATIQDNVRATGNETAIGVA